MKYIIQITWIDNSINYADGVNGGTIDNPNLASIFDIDEANTEARAWYAERYVETVILVDAPVNIDSCIGELVAL